MSRVFWIAWREFVATVSTKGFIIGILITPTVIGVMIVVLPILLKHTPPKVEGELAVVDPTGEVVDGVTAFLQPEAIAERWRETKKKVSNKIEMASFLVYLHLRSSLNCDDIVGFRVGHILKILQSCKSGFKLYTPGT